jgi:hypothetical protein
VKNCGPSAPLRTIALTGTKTRADPNTWDSWTRVNRLSTKACKKTIRLISKISMTFNARRTYILLSKLSLKNLIILARKNPRARRLRNTYPLIITQTPRNLMKNQERTSKYKKAP